MTEQLTIFDSVYFVHYGNQNATIIRFVEPAFNNSQPAASYSYKKESATLDNVPKIITGQRTGVLFHQPIDGGVFLQLDPLTMQLLCTRN